MNITLQSLVLGCCLFVTTPSAAQPQVPAPVQSPGKPSEKKTVTFQNAAAIATNPAHGELYVLDAGTAKLYRLDKDGFFIATVGGYGIENENFDSPRDLTAGDGVSLYIADRGNQRLVRYDRTLNYMFSVNNSPVAQPSSAGGTTGGGTSSGALPEAWRPVSVSVLAQGDLFILEENTRQVIKVNPFDLTRRGGIAPLTFGGFDAGEGRLEEPVQVEVTAAGMVFISDARKGAVMIFDQFGNFLTQAGKGSLDRPSALATGQVESQTPSGEKLLLDRLVVIDAGNGSSGNGSLIIIDATPKKGYGVVRKISNMELASICGISAGTPFTPVDAALTRTDLWLLTKTALHRLPLSLLAAGK